MSSFFQLILATLVFLAAGGKTDKTLAGYIADERAALVMIFKSTIMKPSIHQQLSKPAKHQRRRMQELSAKAVLQLVRPMVSYRTGKGPEALA